MIRAVIVEDEKHSRETLKNLLSEFCTGVEVAGVAGSVDEACAVIPQTKPDLVFLDIELQTGTGFDVLNSLQELHFDVVFTTAFEHYAIKAIKFSSVDYLLKPIDIPELQQAVEKAKEHKGAALQSEKLRALLENINARPEGDRKICLGTQESMEFISIQDILYCEASGSYTQFYLKSGSSLLVSKNLKEYENMLTDHEFLRVHNRFLINLREVKSLVKSEGGYILMNNNSQISISPKKREAFIERMRSL
ncbi:LytTR family two component transcriptional regulator [Anseongella ginsenosidimutans]|uniref:LytTR family two component transcriptional regulator n=1 Tax=Anseongella ginsenosidimutans TaxID=496056 RepID=A0A4R3KN89_9SPHI|nr:LytTR family DNA-binding domain-containing protein [Anseongella ginsenosidimutans]QEC52682.1 response regulator transcription factor [Anseongella ginsenosidimutans]TCS85430.1 LytTR family two component transcriptional regulator [Anseongella ginsenosidimutans]